MVSGRLYAAVSSTPSPGLSSLSLDVVVAEHLVDREHVERAVLEGEPVRLGQALQQNLGLALAVLVGDRIDAADDARAHEDRALVALHHGARAGMAAGTELGLEARRQLDLVERQLVGGRRVGGVGCGLRLVSCSLLAGFALVERTEARAVPAPTAGCAATHEAAERRRAAHRDAEDDEQMDIQSSLCGRLDPASGRSRDDRLSAGLPCRTVSDISRPACNRDSCVRMGHGVRLHPPIGVGRVLLHCGKLGHQRMVRATCGRPDRSRGVAGQQRRPGSGSRRSPSRAARSSRTAPAGNRCRGRR